MDSAELENIAYVYGDVCVRKKRRKRQKLIIVELIFDYFENSTLHGLRYIAEKGLSLVERLFWFLTFVLSIAMCSYLIYNVYLKWVSSPVIVTVNGRLASVGSVPFPSVTICPENKCRNNVYNFTDATYKFYGLYDTETNTSERMNQSFSEEYVDKYLNIRKVCDEDWLELDINAMTNFSKNLIHDITEVAPEPDDIFFECTWYNSKEKCSDLFSRVYTEEGVCYTANSLAASDIFSDNIQKDYAYMDSNIPTKGWSIDKGEYENDSLPKPYPRRGRVYGSSPDLQVLLKINTLEIDKECNTLYSGFKIFLHHPADYPTSSLYYYAALEGYTTSVAISFHQMNTDWSMLNSTAFQYPAEIRQCYFQKERPLRYFKIYTASNCISECLSNYTYAMCNCVEFYMPHDNSSEICNPLNKECTRNARDNMAYLERQASLGVKDVPNLCLCRPACDNIEYDAEILKTEFHMGKKLRKYYQKIGLLDVLETHLKYSRIDLFFKQPQFVTMQRRELFGVTDFFANIGGILSLFLGFSFISLVEIFYFVTLRAGVKLKRDLEEEKKQKKKNDKNP